MWKQDKVYFLAQYFLDSTQAKSFEEAVENETFDEDALLTECGLTDPDFITEISERLNADHISPRAFRLWIENYF